MLKIDEKLEKEIMDFCKLNDITDVSAYFQSIVQKGFNVDKYGNSPIKNLPVVVQVPSDAKVALTEPVRAKIVNLAVEEVKEPTVQTNKAIGNKKIDDDYDIYDN